MNRLNPQSSCLQEPDIGAPNQQDARTIRGGAPASELPMSEGSSSEGDWVPQWSQALQSVLDQPPPLLPRYLMLGGLAFGCAFGMWAWVGQVQQVSRAEGRLIPKGQVYKVQSTVQGEVMHLRVKEGQYVSAGQVIAELDNRLAAAEVERLEKGLAASLTQLKQSQELMERVRSEAANRRAIARAEIQAQQTAILQAQVLASTQQQLVDQTQQEQRAYERRLERLRPLVSEGAIAEEHLFEVEQGVRDRQQTLIRGQGELSRALKETDRLQAEMAQRRAETRQSELETEQRLQQLRLEITQLKSKIQESENLLKAARTRQDSNLIKAPVSGTVSSLSVNNMGEVAEAGETVAEISPDGVPLVLMAALPDSEAGLVRERMPVQLKFNAFPYQDYGIVSGTVLSISPDTQIDERMGAVYRVEIGLESPTVNHNQQNFHLKAGQTATAEILIRKRRIIDVLLDPFRKLQKDTLKL